MPTCHCISFKCGNSGGVAHDQRTIQNHQRQDQQIEFFKASETAQQTLRDHDRRIEIYVSSQALSGSQSGHPDGDGSSHRMWQTGNATNVSISSSMVTLKLIEEELSRLVARGEPQLLTQEKPCSEKDPFPLKVLQMEARHLQNKLNNVQPSNSSVRQQRKPLDQRITLFIRSLNEANEAWVKKASSFALVEAPLNYDTERHFRSILGGVDPIVQLSMFTMVALQVVLLLSRRGCHFLLAMIQAILQEALSRHKSSISPQNATLLQKFPVDPDSVLEKCSLEGKEVISAICPNSKCHKTYPPCFKENNPIPFYPKYCTRQEFRDGPICSTALTRARRVDNFSYQEPIKRCISYSFTDFMANLLSRLEKQMDQPKRSSSGQMEDVSDGDFLHDFKDYNGQPFQSSEDGVGRYTFSLGMDFFNPLGNKQAGKKISVGIVSLVCLSLPEELRYKTENMFLATIIPGPKEPPLDAINHYLTPLIDELLPLWNPGIHFSRTASYPMGRLVLCALILVVCDLVAARKVGGFAACTHNHFCSVCHCKLRGDGETLRNNSTDYHGWKRRTNADCRSSAEKFREARTEKARRSTFDTTGMRWSELLRLPYFDITRCVIVDSMHNLFLGLIKEHFRKILGIGLPLYQEGAVFAIEFNLPPAKFTPNDQAGLKRIKKLLELPCQLAFPTCEEGITNLTKITRNVLEFVCKELHLNLRITSRTTKKDFAEKIYYWRLAQPEQRVTGADTSSRHGHVIFPEELREIWQDLEQILTPSWITSLPSKLGSKSHGKLKADQWRTLGSVHLPLSLIRLWGSVNISDSRSLRCRQILDVTMSLLSAVIIATSHTTSHAQADAYLHHMLNYLNGIKELFPEYKLRPNHHMALHLCEFLSLFGPVHSWWTFPFERMIGRLQHMPHNFKPGEIEVTMARAYTRSANLRALVTKSTCPEVIRRTFSVFQKLVDPQVHSTLHTDIQLLASLVDVDDEKEFTLDAVAPISKALPNELTVPFQRAGLVVKAPYYLPPLVRIQGMSFSIISKHRGNAAIMIFHANPVPAYISHIIQTIVNKKVTTFLAVHRLKSLPLAYDPYATYPVLGAKLWDSDLGEVEVISVTDIVSHFACLPLRVHWLQALVVVPLWRSVNIDK